mgnify:CR=1 FL=1
MTPVESADLEREDLRALMSTPAGRRTVFRLLDRNCNLIGGSFIPGDTHASAHEEGRRSVGRLLVVQLQRECPDNFCAMISEGFYALSAALLQQQKK